MLFYGGNLVSVSGYPLLGVDAPPAIDIGGSDGHRCLRVVLDAVTGMQSYLFALHPGGRFHPGCDLTLYTRTNFGMTSSAPTHIVVPPQVLPLFQIMLLIYRANYTLCPTARLFFNRGYSYHYGGRCFRTPCPNLIVLI